MPVVADSSFPDFHQLAAEGLVCTPDSRTARQGVGLDVAVFNVMPNKARTAADVARLVGAAGQPVRLTFIRPTVMEACEREFIQELDHKPYAAVWRHHFSTYVTRNEVRGRTFHGVILTGAPLGGQPVETLTYWNEWCEFFTTASHATGSVLAICLAAMGAAQHLHGIRKETLPQKLSGVYPQQVRVPQDPLLQGVGPVFPTPVSRYSRLPEAALAKAGVQVLAGHAETGAGLLRLSPDIVGLTVHPEYTHDTLHAEYSNALKRHLTQPGFPAPQPPVNYYEGDHPAGGLRPNNWKQSAHVLGVNLVREMRERAMAKGLLMDPAEAKLTPTTLRSRAVGQRQLS